MQLRAAVRERRRTLSAIAAEMDASRARLNRILDPEAFNVTPETPSRAAKVVGRGLGWSWFRAAQLRYVPRPIPVYTIQTHI